MSYLEQEIKNILTLLFISVLFFDLLNFPQLKSLRNNMTMEFKVGTYVFGTPHTEEKKGDDAKHNII